MAKEKPERKNTEIAFQIEWLVSLWYEFLLKGISKEILIVIFSNISEQELSVAKAKDAFKRGLARATRNANNYA